MNEPVTILTAVEDEDEYGNPVLDWSNPTEVAARGMFEPVSATELPGEAPQTTARLYLAPGAQVTRVDRVEARGAVWVVTGDPEDWRGPGGFGGVVVPLGKSVAQQEVGS